jgi:hypothetical protein
MWGQQRRLAEAIEQLRCEGITTGKPVVDQAVLGRLAKRDRELEAWKNSLEAHISNCFARR